MQAAECAGGVRMASGMQVQLPAPLRELALAVLLPLGEQLSSIAPKALQVSSLGSGDSPRVCVESGAHGWWLEHGPSRERAADAEELLLRLQELELEAAARRGQWLLFRSSVVTRGSQSVMIVGADDPAYVGLSVALAALEFRPASIGHTAFDCRAGRGCPIPLPLRLAFRLATEEQDALRSLSSDALRHLAPLTPTLFRPADAAAAREPTHILFPDAAHPTGILVRPLSAAAARARLCDAITVAPDDPSPFAAIAALLRHARGIYLACDDLPSALEQLARLLPHWEVG